MRPRLWVLAALMIGPSMVVGQEVSSAEWRACARTGDSLERLNCFEGLAVGASSAEWRGCAGTSDSLVRLNCFDNLKMEVSSAEMRACAGTDDSLARLSCFDNLAIAASSAEWRACAGDGDSVARLSCYDQLALEVSFVELRGCAGTIDSLARLACFDDLALGVSYDSKVCAEEQDSLLRLNCYENLVRQLGDPAEPKVVRAEPEPPQPPAEVTARPPADGTGQPPDLGSWQLKEEIDANNRTAWIATLSPDIEQSSLKETARLALRCKNGDLEIFIGFNEFLAFNSPIAIGFDEDMAQDQSWYTSTDNKFLFARPAQMLGFLQKLQSSKRLTIRVTVDGEGPRTAVFSLDAEETKGVLDSIREDCPTVGQGRRAARW